MKKLLSFFTGLLAILLACGIFIAVLMPSFLKKKENPNSVYEEKIKMLSDSLEKDKSIFNILKKQAEEIENRIDTTVITIIKEKHVKIKTDIRVLGTDESVVLLTRNLSK